MPVLRCPICGCEASDLSQLQTLAAPQSVDESDAEVVICHCMESHRFLVSLGQTFSSRRCDERAPLRLKQGGRGA
jgi:hypothetical protein